jgi:hypothetical protein
VLHPRYKLDYFKKAGWLPEWIETAEELICNTFDMFYASDGDADRLTPEPAKQVGSTYAVTSCQSERQQSGPRASNMFDELPAFAVPKSLQADDELASYLRSETEFVKEVIQWWHSKTHIYPRLSRMALDHLTILGRLCTFSHDTLTDMHPQQHLLMSSESSAKVMSYSLTSGTAC